MRIEFLYPRVGGLDAEKVQDVLSLVMKTPPSINLIKEWSRQERVVAYDWAIREHMHASDNLRIRRREQPRFVKEELRG